MTTREAVADRLIVALSDLVEISGQISSHEAVAAFDETTREVIFRDWPQLRSWGEAVWQKLGEDLARPALPDDNPASPETGTVD
jgi:hypothetical protein